MDKILITGATSVIGRSILQANVINQKKLLLLVSSERKGLELIKTYGLADAEIAVILPDFPIQEVIDFNPEVALHLAGYTSNSLLPQEVIKLVDANINFGSLLLTSLKGTNLKYFINVGSGMEFGDNSTELAPSNFYAATKLAFRTILDYFSKTMNFQLFQVNVYFVYGEKGARKKVIDYLLDGKEAEVPIKMSPGEQCLDFIHINDVVAFFSKLLLNLEKSEDNYTQFFVGSGKSHTIKEVAKVIEKIIHQKLNLEWGGIPYRKEEIMLSTAPQKNNPKFLNWKPVIELEEGLQLYLNNY
ncbi:MAG: NAD(P)-dependent oxidoreductase [Saprospiraceae bacterium]